MANQTCIDFGFKGNDVVTGFCGFFHDLLNEEVRELSSYSGLVYRNQSGEVKVNSENPTEYSGLSLVDYSLADSLLPHLKRYLSDQQSTYSFMKGRGLRSMVVDIGRGCIKLAGKQANGIPVSACDFCGIVAGSKPIAHKGVQKAWATLQNAYEQGFNYFYVSADELPLTLWPLVKGMVEETPSWYNSLPVDERPRMFGYARAEAFALHPDRINTLVDEMRMDHFFVGFDGLSEISLQMMNKAPKGSGQTDLMGQNLVAMEMLSRRGCLVTAGIVLTHLGITPEIMKGNLRTIEDQVEKHPNAFVALDFGPLCPIPGSQAFQNLTNPDLAEERAQRFGLKVDRTYLEAMRDKYVGQDVMDISELINDYVRGCCPEISMEIVEEHIERITDIATKHGIVVGGGV